MWLGLESDLDMAFTSGAVSASCGKPAHFFAEPLNVPTGATTQIPYDVTAYGRRFLMSVSLVNATTTTSTPITVITSWPSALKR